MNDNDIKNSWNRNAPGWIAGVQGGFDTYRSHINNPAFFNELGDIANMQILDVGCGEGFNTRLCARLGAQMTGIDISDILIESAIQIELEAPLGISYHVCSASEMSKHIAGPFDAAVSFMAMMDLPDYNAAVREVALLIKPGGLFTFSILHPNMTSSLGFVLNDSGSRTGYKIGDYFGLENKLDFDRWYFSHAPDSMKDRHGQFDVCYFKRTISEYLNTLIAHGFNIEKVWEPLADDDAIEKYPDMAVTKSVPFFLGIKSRKANI